MAPVQAVVAAFFVAVALLAPHSVLGGNPFPSPSPVCEAPLELLAHWDMEEGSGTVLNDITGNGHAAELNSSVTYTTGRVGSFATSYNGDTTSHATVPNIPPLSTVGQLSVFMWVFPEDASTVIFSTWGSTAGAYHLWILGSQFNFHYVDSGIVRNILDPTVSTLGVWYHVGFILDPCTGTSELYVDGNLVVSGVYGASQLEVNSYDITIGGKASHDFGFIGDLDDIRYYSGRLPGATITSLAGIP